MLGVVSFVPVVARLNRHALAGSHRGRAGLEIPPPVGRGGHDKGNRVTPAVTYIADGVTTDS